MFVQGVNSEQILCAVLFTILSCLKSLFLFLLTATDECSSNPCLNGAMCMNGIDKFACYCRSGFTGDICQTESGMSFTSLNTLVVVCYLDCRTRSWNVMGLNPNPTADFLFCFVVNKFCHQVCQKKLMQSPVLIKLTFCVRKECKLK